MKEAAAVPTYQYSCTECGHFFEQVQSFSEDSLTTCPQCEGRLRKVFNAVGVVFKGSGFYRTDSRADSRTGSSAGDGSGTGSDKSGSKGRLREGRLREGRLRHGRAEGVVGLLDRVRLRRQRLVRQRRRRLLLGQLHDLGHEGRQRRLTRPAGPPTGQTAQCPVCPTP